MKKVVSIFLSILFLASAIGINIHSHYCGGKLESVGVIKKKSCCDDEKSMPENCCKNETNYVKVNSDYSPAFEFHLAKTTFSSAIIYFEFTPKISFKNYSVLKNNHSPPPKFLDRVIDFRSILV